MKRNYSFFARFKFAALAAALLLLTAMAGHSQSSCFSFGMPLVSGAEGDVVTIPVSVRNFDGIISAQFNLVWPADALEFVVPIDYSASGNPLGLTGANFNTSIPGLLRATWFDQNALGVDLPDDVVLFSLKFRIKTAQAEFIPIHFDQVPNASVYEVVAEPGGLLAFPLRVGGVYANTPIPPAPPVVDEICSTPSTGSCQNPAGSVSPVVSGGVPPYTFAWSGPAGFTSTVQNISNLIYGLYHLTITDQAGTVVYSDVAITSDVLPLSVSGQAHDASCSGDDGCIELTVSTSNWPVTLDWSAPGLAGQDVCGLSPGTYTVTATDASGCTAARSFEVEAQNSLVVDLLVSPANCVNGQLGGAVAVPKNGVWPYQYLWSTNTITQLNANLPFGAYTVTVTDSEGCSAVETAFVNDATVLSWDMYLNANCSGGGQGNVLLYSGDPAAIAFPLTVAWSNGTTTVVPAAADTLAILSMAPSGLYSVLVTDAQGCSQNLEIALSCFGPTPQDSAALVWPGDADNNNAVNHHDLLYLGLAYGAAGQQRPGATTNWVGQPAPDWSQNTAGYVVNFKNMDTNGDGSVNAADTAAIVANWGLVVDPMADNPFAAPVSVPGMGVSPALALPADTLFAGQMTWIPVVLGTENIPADNLHGLAFSISYNPKVLRPEYFEPVDSWFGTPDDGLLCLQRHFPGQNRLDVALTRTDGLPTGGFGLIGRMFIIIEDDIFFKKDLDEPESEDESTITTRIFVRNIQALTPSNTQTEVASVESRVVISQTVSTDLPPDQDQMIALWPNPASEILHIASPEELLRAVSIADMAGRIQFRKTDVQAATVEVPVRDWAPGAYLVQVQTGRGVATRLLIIGAH